MDFSAVCRTCLSSDYLKSLFFDGEDYKIYINAIKTATGLDIEINDGLPQKICINCIKSLNDYIKFRKTCIETYNFLLNIKREDNIEITETGITDVQATENIKNYNYQEDEDKPLTYLIDNDYELNNENVSATEIQETKYVCPTELKDDKEIEQRKHNTRERKCRTDTNKKIESLYAHTNEKRVICKLCQKELSIRSVDMHMARCHPGADERKVKCELCDKYLRKEKIKRHVLLIHGMGAQKCGYCKSEYSSRESLIEHVETCSAKKKKRKISETSRELVECDVCNKSMQKASLRMHKAVKHAGLGPVCEHCGKRFGNKFRLNEHYRAKHDYEKFKCSDCDFESAGIMAMRNHERRHRGEKPYACDTCGATFHAAYLLAQHKQSHRTEKNVKCDLCPATFKANNSLHMHKLTCHSTSLYKCSMCSRAYSCRHYAVKHLRLVHRYKGPVPKLPREPE